MNKTVIALFPTPLYKNSLERNDDDILNYTKKVKFKELRIGNGHVSEDVYVLENQEIQELKEQIQSNINFFVYEVLDITTDVEFYITNSWIMKHKRNNWSQEHDHPNSLISGIYYFDVNDESGSIGFTKNNSPLNLFPPTFEFHYNSNDNMFNQNEFQYTPKNKDLFLFPSHLRHFVNPNSSDKERHCLAFNVFVKGTLGTDIAFNRIDFK